MYRYTSNTSSVIIDSYIYNTANFKIGDFTKSESLDDNSVSIDFSKNNDFAKDIQELNFVEEIEIQIDKYDSETNSRVLVFFGTSTSVSKNLYDITVEFTSNFSEIKRTAINCYCFIYVS